MTDLRLQVRVRDAISRLLKSLDEYHIPVDVLRAVHEESALMKETEEVRDSFGADPFEELGADSIPRDRLERFQRRLGVVSCSRTRIGFDHASVDAVVRIADGAVANNLQLFFSYKRERDGARGCRVWYSIETSYGYRERKMLLLVQVFAADGVPSAEAKAAAWVPLLPGEQKSRDGGDDDDDDDENDGSDDDDSNTVITCSDSSKTSEASQPPKKKRKGDAAPNEEVPPHEDDAYSASVDPDVLREFLEASDLLPISELSGVFLLFTFPFYEHEWDLVGFVLEEVFGAGSDDERSESHEGDDGVGE